MRGPRIGLTPMSAISTTWTTHTTCSIPCTLGFELRLSLSYNKDGLDAPPPNLNGGTFCALKLSLRPGEGSFSPPVEGHSLTPALCVICDREDPKVRTNNAWLENHAHGAECPGGHYVRTVIGRQIVSVVGSDTAYQQVGATRVCHDNVLGGTLLSDFCTRECESGRVERNGWRL